MTKPKIRLAEPTDLPGVLALYSQLHPDDPAVDVQVAQNVWEALISHGMTYVFVADAASRLASSCTLAIVPNLTRGARPYGVLENVVTDVSHRRMGLGRAVLHAALVKAWEANCYKVILATGSPKEATLRFYESAGFQSGGKTYFEARRP